MGHLVDSSVWVALYLDNDSNHQKAATLFPSLKGDIVIPYCVISEVATVLAYRHSKEQANAFLDFLRASSNVVLFDSRMDEEIDAYRSLNSRISFADCTLIHLAKHLRADLVTFDKQQTKVLKKQFTTL